MWVATTLAMLSYHFSHHSMVQFLKITPEIKKRKLILEIHASSFHDYGEVRIFHPSASPGIHPPWEDLSTPDGVSDRGAGPFSPNSRNQKLRLQDVNIRWSRKECTKSLARWPGLNFRCFFSGIKNDRWQTSSKSSKHLEAKNAVRRDRRNLFAKSDE